MENKQKQLISQIYVCTTVNEAPLAVQRFIACVSDISDWMSASRLKLNPMKTEVLWLGSSQLHTGEKSGLRGQIECGFLAHVL